MGSTMIPGASATVPLEECLAAQFENRQWLGVFGAKGQGQGQGGEEGARLNVNLLLHLIYRKFYSAGE
jgi:Ras GTPase-activating-like protein IQGAP2/3